MNEYIKPNVKASFMPKCIRPSIGHNCKINNKAVIIGAAIIGDNVAIGKKSVIRADEGFEISIGDNATLGEEIVIHGLETQDYGLRAERNIVKVNEKEYSVYIGMNCNIGDGAQVHGPAVLMDNVVLCPDSFIFKACIEEGAFIGQGAKVIGVTIKKGRFVPSWFVITTNEQADALGKVIEEQPVLTRQNHLAGKTIKEVLIIKKGRDTYIDNTAILSGLVSLGEEVYIAPYAHLIADCGEIKIGDCSNVQDGVILSSGDNIKNVIVENKCSLAHQCKIFGGKVGYGTFVGMQSQLYDVEVGKDCVIEPGCIVKNVIIPEKRYISCGSRIFNQHQADELPNITEDYTFAKLNKEVVHVNEQLAKGYSNQQIK